jgi:hypothetical protein
MKRFLAVLSLLAAAVSAVAQTYTTNWATTVTTTTVNGQTTSVTNRVPVSVTTTIAPVTTPIASSPLTVTPFAATTAPATNATPSAIPALPGAVGWIADQLVDDAPYISNGVVQADVAVLFNKSNPVGTGHVGVYGDIVFPSSKQSAVGVGGGYVAKRGFVTPVTLTLGTTMTNLPAAIGNVYSFASDGLLYDFNGQAFGNWAAVGFFKNWTLSRQMSLGIKVGTYDDSVVPGIGWFFDVCGTF